MGLGKTIQTIGFLRGLARLDAVRDRGPHLVVAPLSLVSQVRNTHDVAGAAYRSRLVTTQNKESRLLT